ncbi:MAG: hypothetical protein HDT39_01935 [Lachnospiraceae bacterium]|nr:hypothetical protein [Lachnospiraceae bacterium]
MKKKIITASMVVCILLIVACCYVWKKEQANKELDFTKIDRLSLWVGNDELFTENKALIKKMFPKDSTYIKTKDDIPEFAGGMCFNAYDGKKLLFEANPIGAELEEQYMYINGELYKVENPPDYDEICDLIQKENKD